MKLIKKNKNIKLLHSINLKKILYKDNAILCDLDKIKIQSKLLIASDGKNSWVRNLLKTPIYEKKYKQKALVVNFHHTKNHNSIAYELFFKSGPLAILPMIKESKNNFCSSVIWSHAPNYINSLEITEEDKEYLNKLVLENYCGIF